MPVYAANITHANILLLGEVHGTNEIPNLVLAKYKHNKNLVVGLELPQSAVIGACGKLHDYWLKKKQDGRTSKAMRDLICELDKRNILYYGIVPERDEMDNIIKSGRHPYADLIIKRFSGYKNGIILLGNRHTDLKLSTLTRDLTGHFFKTQTASVGYGAGSAWVCFSRDECGETKFGAQVCPKPSKRCYYLKTITASRPAIEY